MCMFGAVVFGFTLFFPSCAASNVSYSGIIGDGGSEIWGMDTFEKAQPAISQAAMKKEFWIFTDPNKIRSVYLSRVSTCAVISFNMTITERGERHVKARIDQEKNPYEELWPHPFHVCALPSGRMSSHSSVLIKTIDSFMLLPFYAVLYIFLLLLSALFTGLNLSLMSLGVEDLELIRDYDDEEKNRQYASDILQFRRQSNFMLCTILMGNTVCNTISTVLFDAIMKDLHISEQWVHMLVVIMIPALLQLVFAEILPQILCTKYALRIGSKMRMVMEFFMVLTAPFSWPLAKFLDWSVGKEQRNEMNEYAKINDAIAERKAGREMVEIQVVENALNLQVRRAKDVMTNIDKVFMISDSTPVNADLKKQLATFKHTRIPVFKGDDRNDICGVINKKDLILIEECYELTVGLVMQLFFRSTRFRFVLSDMPVPDLMMELKAGVPLSFVMLFEPAPKKYKVIGIVTLEDNLEEVVGEIYDEKDLTGAAIVTASAKPESKLPRSDTKASKNVKKDAEVGSRQDWYRRASAFDEPKGPQAPGKNKRTKL